MKFFVAFLAITAVALGMPHKTLWTLHDLSEAIQNPSTDPHALPYLEAALNEMMDSIMAGENMEAITVSLPSPVIVTPTPTVPSLPSQVPPAIASPGAPSASSPLVQIVVNVNQPQNVQTPVPEQPIYVPEPIEIPTEKPEGPIVVDQAPEPVIIVEQPENPIDIIAINPPEVPQNPIDVIAISPPEVPQNPIDVIAVSPPEVPQNPADILHPVPVIPVLAI